MKTSYSTIEKTYPLMWRAFSELLEEKECQADSEGVDTSNRSQQFFGLDGAHYAGCLPSCREISERAGCHLSAVIVVFGGGRWCSECGVVIPYSQSLMGYGLCNMHLLS